MSADKKLQELQFLEQNVENILYQKQAFSMELSETEAALKEIESAGNEIYKLIGNLMVKSSKIKIKEELKNKERLLKLRLDSLEKQEINLVERRDSIREEILEKKK